MLALAWLVWGLSLVVNMERAEEQPSIDPWPAEFLERMRGWLGSEADDFFAALARRDIGLRLNSLRGPLDSLRARIPWSNIPVPWCPEGIWLQPEDTEAAYTEAEYVNAEPGEVPRRSRAGQPGEKVSAGVHPYHTAGVYYIQDPSAMAAAVILAPKPGEWVLDVAAAPGGKATHLAARMQNQGVLVANDVSRRRVPVLAMNLERMGVTNALITNEYPDRLAARWGRMFDAVLVDAPCSGEGMFSRDSQAAQEWSLASIQGNARRQRIIMEQSAPLLCPGGRLLYGTCTFAPEENESIIADFLAEHPEFELADLPRLPGLGPGQPVVSLSNHLSNEPECGTMLGELRRTGRFWPHTGPGHGHFYALLRRKGNLSHNLPVRWTGTQVPGRVMHLYRQALGKVLSAPPPEEGLMLSKDDVLYITPMEPKLWDGLRVLRPGWWIASLRHGRVKPDHALAMALKPEEARATHSLPLDDMGGQSPHIHKFLRGDFWADRGPAGWVLVTVEGFPLGWGKRGGGRLRSRYPIHLRRGTH